MNTKNIIEDIERRYTQYSLSDSDTTLYYLTMDYMRFLKSFDIVNSIMNEVMMQYPYSESFLKKGSSYCKLPHDIMKAVGVSRESYVSFLLHYLEWTFKKESVIELYNDATWICSNNSDYDKKDRIRLFQQNVIYPVAIYVIDKLREGKLLCDVLEHFSNRAIRFKCLQGVKDEKEIQNRIALYLYDNGNENHREENSGNGNADFLISDTNGKFVVEIKYVKANSRKGKNAFEKWTSQLKYYMNQYSSYQGVLYIVSEENCRFEWKNAPANMTVMNVYIGDLKPSEMTKPKVYEIDI